MAAPANKEIEFNYDIEEGLKIECDVEELVKFAVQNNQVTAKAVYRVNRWSSPDVTNFSDLSQDDVDIQLNAYLEDGVVYINTDDQFYPDAAVICIWDIKEKL